MIVKQVDVRMIFHMIILKNKKTFLRIVGLPKVGKLLTTEVL